MLIFSQRARGLIFTFAFFRADAAEDSVPENYYQIVADRLRDGLKNQVRRTKCRKLLPEFHGLLASMNVLYIYIVYR